MIRISSAALIFAVALLMAVAGAGGGAAAGERAPLALTGEDGSFSLRGHLEIFEDSGAGLGIGEVAAGGAFRPRSADVEERNYTAGAIWYRFTVVRGAAMPERWILAIGEPFIDDIRLFAPAGDGGWRESRLGRNSPSRELPLAGRHHLVALDLPAAVPVTLYIRLASSDEIQFDAALWRPEALMFEEVRQSTIAGMFFAALIFIVVIYLLFGVWLRDPPMLAYAAYVATFVLFGISHSGIAAILFPGGTPGTLLTGLGVLGNVAALIVMWDGVLDLRRTRPAFHRLYRGALAGVIALLPLVLTPWYVLVVRPTFVMTLAVTLVSLYLAAAQLRRDRANSLLKFYVAAFIPFLLFSMVHAAEIVFPGLDILFVRRLGSVAMLIHIAILSVALVYRIRRIQQERARAGVELAAARSAMREHRNFVSMLSHQLRTPLAIIIAAVDLLDLRTAGSDETAKIRRAALRMRDLATEVLADSRLTEVAAIPEPHPVDLVPLLEAQCRERRDASEQRLRLDSAVDGGGAVVDGDRALLEVLFANLLDNAGKYAAPAGEVRVRLSRDGGDVVVTVADDGPGIAAAEAGLVFEKYYRSPAASSRPGTGLGLYLVRQIAERHGGAVSLASTPGQGAAFTVRLPSAQLAVPANT